MPPTPEPTPEPTPVPSPTPALLTVPDVVGLPESDAVAALEATGLVVGERVERPHRRIPAGTVIRTRPDAGETVDPGTPVEVVVSIGQPATPEPTLPPTTEPVLTVPDVTDLAEADAAAQLESVGLTVGDRVERENERVAPAPSSGRGPRPVRPSTRAHPSTLISRPDCPRRRARSHPPARLRCRCRRRSSRLPRRRSPASSLPLQRPSPTTSSPESRRLASCAPTSDRVMRAGRSSDRTARCGATPHRSASRIAEALGIDTAFTTEPLDDVVAGGWADRWDISFDHLVATDPSVGALALSQPYAWEPVTFAAGPESGVNADDMTGLAVCVVVGSIAERWLGGTIGLVDAAGGQPVPPAVGSLVQAGSDEDCLEPSSTVRPGWAASATTLRPRSPTARRS